MEGFTVIDLIVAGVILLSAVLAYARGFVREVTAIAGWVGAGVLAYIFAPTVEPLVREIPGLGDFLGRSCELSIVIAFAGVFVVALVILSLFTPLLASFVKGSALNGIDQGLGFLFGALRGILLVAVAFVVYDLLVSDEVAVVANSRSAAVFADSSEPIYERLPEEGVPDWLARRYELLVGDCGTPV